VLYIRYLICLLLKLLLQMFRHVGYLLVCLRIMVRLLCFVEEKNEEDAAWAPAP
jgi:hypothetical protein